MRLDDWTGPLACLSPFSVIPWKRSSNCLKLRSDILKHGILKKLVTCISIDSFQVTCIITVYSIVMQLYPFFNDPFELISFWTDEIDNKLPWSQSKSINLKIASLIKTAQVLKSFMITAQKFSTELSLPRGGGDTVGKIEFFKQTLLIAVILHLRV